MNDNLVKTRKLVLTAMFFALTLILSIVENILPPISIAIPGIKLGLSNIAVMYSLFYIGNGACITIAILKSVFVMFTRGAMAGLLSFSGGVLSVIVMILLIYIAKDKISYLLLSISGAVTHNIGQYFIVSIIYTTAYIVYLPVLIISGIIVGSITATLLRITLCQLKRLK